MIFCKERATGSDNGASLQRRKNVSEEAQDENNNR